MTGLEDAELELLASLEGVRLALVRTPARDRLERLGLISEEPADHRRKVYRFGLTRLGVRALREACS